MPGAIGRPTPPSSPPGATRRRCSRSAASTSPARRSSTPQQWGSVDRAFHENLVDRAPGDDLTRFLRGLDLVVESGSTGRPLPAAFARILDCGAGGRRPWFLYCPRPDVDWTALDRVWAEHGYRAESLCLRPVRYRKPLNAQEREEMLCGTRALGKPDHAVMRDGYLLVDMTLARPAADTDNPPIAELRRNDD